MMIKTDVWEKLILNLFLSPPHYLDPISQSCEAHKFAQHEWQIQSYQPNFPFCCILLVTGILLLLAYPENHVEIWLVILFLSRKKFNATQICVLNSSMKLLGPVCLVSLFVVCLSRLAPTSLGFIDSLILVLFLSTQINSFPLSSVLLDHVNFVHNKCDLVHSSSTLAGTILHRSYGKVDILCRNFHIKPRVVKVKAGKF